MTKKRGLSGARGLEALIGGIKAEKRRNDTLQNALKDGRFEETDDASLVHIDVAALQAGKYQPRKDMDADALAELCASIAKHGVMQPIVIRPLPVSDQKNGVTHEIVAGERRWRAAKMAGLAQIPAILRTLSDDMAIALALIENIQREDLNALEQAQALQRFHSEFGLSHAAIADVVGKARATVSNLLRLNQLHDAVKDCIRQGQLDMGHARALLPLPQPQQPIIAKKIVEKNMTVRQAERLVKSILDPQSTAKNASDGGQLGVLGQKIADRLGAAVKVKQSKDGKGSVEIFFASDDELASLLTLFEVER